MKKCSVEHFSDPSGGVWFLPPQDSEGLLGQRVLLPEAANAHDAEANRRSVRVGDRTRCCSN